MPDYQHPDVLRLGERLYPKLSIVEEPDPQHPTLWDVGDAVSFESFVFLTSFEESFNARWETGNRSYGRLNPMYYYGGTEREAKISFTLPAITVQESNQNLLKCSELSRAVYGQYREWSVDSIVDGMVVPSEIKDFTLMGHRYFRANLGSLIMNERVFVSSFSFNVDMDAGVFEVDKSYYSAEAAVSRMNPEGSDINPVETGNPEEIYPRRIDIEISLIFRHDYALGFGGPNRIGHPKKWASNLGEDFPHGTGFSTIPPYMAFTEGTEVIARTEEDATADYRSARAEYHHDNMEDLKDQADVAASNEDCTPPFLCDDVAESPED